MRSLAERLRPEIEARFPKVQRRVGGYNLDQLLLTNPHDAGLLVGSEGTLALSTAITLKLSRLPTHRVMGICHFPSFRAAMETTRHLVDLRPTAVELVDNNVLTLGADMPLFRRTLDRITKGRPDCLLLVEFAGDAAAPLLQDLAAARGLHGRPRLSRCHRRRHRPRRAARGLGDARGLSEHHDVGPRRRQSRSASSRIAPFRWSIWPTTPTRSPRCSTGTARVAPGMPMPRSVACTFARS